MVHKENGNIHSDHFDSVMEFVHHIRTAKTNASFDWYKGKNLSSMMVCNRGTNTYKWYGCTEDFAEAQSLLQNGYAEGLNAILKSEGKVKADKRPTRRDTDDYMGYRPNVQRYIQGLPNSMVRRYTEYKRAKVIKIYYDCGAGSRIAGKELATAGKNIMTLVRHYEQNHCNVELYVIASSCDDKSMEGTRKAVLTIKIKDAKQHLNPLLISYPVTHPAFFRRHIFRWKETSECTDTTSFPYVYGYQIRYVLRDSTMQDWLRDNKLIPHDAHYLDSERVAKAESLQEIINMIN